MSQDEPQRQIVSLPLTKKDYKLLRHRWHRVIILLSTATTLGALVLAAFILVLMTVADEGLREIFSVEEYEQISGFALLALLAPFALPLLHTLRAAEASATGALATDQQFEHVHLMVEHYSRLGGLSHTPSVAIVSGGDFSAKTTSSLGRAVILIHSDLLAAPRPFGQDWGALRFAIAREVGHIAAGHRGLLYELRTAVTQAIPYVSNPLRRTEEYTADRYGAVLAPDAAPDYFAVTAVSKDCWQDMSLRATVARAGQVRIGQLLTSWTGKVPPIVWRVQTLAWWGIFLCEPTISPAQSPDEYRKYLSQLPTWPVRRDDLRRRHGAFLRTPKPMPRQTLDELCPPGTNLDRLTRAAAH